MLPQRRLFLSALLAGELTTSASGSRAQGVPRVWRVGFLSAAERPASIDGDRIGAFRRGMRSLGYVEGSNLVIEWRFADGDPQRLAQLAQELVGLRVDVIVTAGVPPTAAAKRATTQIPIVMGTATDPLGSGLVKSLAKPDANITGLSNASVDTGPKHVQMLLEAVPALSSIAMLLDRGTSTHAAILERTSGAARSSGLTVYQREVATPAQIEEAVDVLSHQKVGALIIPVSPLFNQQTRQIAALCLARRIPSISGFVEFAAGGGLMSYGQNLANHYFRAATYVDKLLKGVPPAQLPIEQPMKFDLVINRATASALKITMPASLLILADSIVG